MTTRSDDEPSPRALAMARGFGMLVGFVLAKLYVWDALRRLLR